MVARSAELTAGRRLDVARRTARHSGGDAVGDLVDERVLHPGERDTGHQRRLDRQRDEVLRLEVVDVRLPAGAGERLRLERQHAQVVRDACARRAPGRSGRRARRPASRCRPGRGPPASRRRSRRSCRSSGTRSSYSGLLSPIAIERRRADRDRVRAERERLRDVRAAADPAGHDQLHLAVQAELLQRLHGERDRRSSVGMPTCSMKTSWVAAVPPCMPSTTITSAPAFTASWTS